MSDNKIAKAIMPVPRFRTLWISVFSLMLSLLCAADASAQAKKTTAAKTPSPSTALLQLAAVNALIVDSSTGETIYAKNQNRVVPIASVSKLMTAMVTLDAKQPLDEIITIEYSDIDALDNVFSRVRRGSQLTRADVLRLALMSSENRAAASLAQHYPGGAAAFVTSMNKKAKALGMTHTRFVEPTGLSYQNVSTAHDLVKMVQAANHYPEIKAFTTTKMRDQRFIKPRYGLAFYNTNALIRNDAWDIDVSKTGFNNKAGHCLVMQTTIADKPVTMIFLDTFGKRSTFGDAMRVRRWMETGEIGKPPAGARRYEATRLRESEDYADAS